MITKIWKSARLLILVALIANLKLIWSMRYIFFFFLMLSQSHSWPLWSLQDLGSGWILLFWSIVSICAKSNIWVNATLDRRIVYFCPVLYAISYHQRLSSDLAPYFPSIHRLVIKAMLLSEDACIYCILFVQLGVLRTKKRARNYFFHVSGKRKARWKGSPLEKRKGYAVTL